MSDKPKLPSHLAARRSIVGLSVDQAASLHHRCTVASEMLLAIKAAALKSAADECVIDPLSLAQWIESHDGQLNLATAEVQHENA